MLKHDQSCNSEKKKKSMKDGERTERVIQETAEWEGKAEQLTSHGQGL